MHILIIDDDKVVCRLYAAVLEEEGWQVSYAENGIQGLKTLTTLQPDIILLDLLMPKMNGFVFLDKLKTNPERNQIPIIVMTAKDLTWEDYQRLDRRVARIFLKSEPGSVAELVPAIKAVTGEK